MLRARLVSRLAAAAIVLGLAAPVPAAARNLVIFVADGLRSHIVTDETAPDLAKARAEGVDFADSHSVYPTVTTVNASAIATGHYPGDTGDFGNVLYVGKPFAAPYASQVQALEDDDVLGLMNERFDGNYLGETSLLQAARAQGYSTAVIGKLGPVGVQDVTARDGNGTIVIDDATGWKEFGGLPLAPDVAAAIKAAGLPAQAADRGLNQWPGAYNMPGVRVSNAEQQAWFLAVATKVLLPRFKAAGKPFVLIYWSRDPDGTQHNTGDSLNKLTPGINGPVALSGVRDASDNLGALRKALADLGLAGDTDVIMTADHGFATISRESKTSAAAKLSYPDVVPGFLPPGFLGVDMAKDLDMPLYDGAGLPVNTAEGFYPKGAAILGKDPAAPEVVIAPNGGSDLIYLPGADAKTLAARVVDFLTRQDYTGAIFVRDDLGPIPGALPTSKVGLAGDARTPSPAVVVSFRSFDTGCADPEICAVEVADTSLQEGQGIHGSLARHNTHNFMAAVGPDFRKAFVDPTPVSNADLSVTAAHLLGLKIEPRGQAVGRVAAEALAADGAPVAHEAFTLRSEPAANGFVTILNGQTAEGRSYFDAAGAPGRAVGLKP
ncbi:alkaline phosphatase family protein [Phenylobacterium sp.]|uniref:alkaline phosphatase family protein n=1 Tax=Phenylobacterium sp. TaxID=1871053 RepID=UPI0035B4E150